MNGTWDLSMTTGGIDDTYGHGYQVHPLVRRRHQKGGESIVHYSHYPEETMIHNVLFLY